MRHTEARTRLGASARALGAGGTPAMTWIEGIGKGSGDRGFGKKERN